MLIFLAAVFILVILVIIIIYHDMHNFVVRYYDIETDKLKEDRTFCLLSDLHDNSYGENNIRLVDAIDKVSPDAILVAGDMITAHHASLNQNTKPAISLFKALADKYLFFIGNGNHEFKIREYTDLYGDAYDKYLEELKALNLDIMINEFNEMPGDNVRVYGLELNYYFFRKLFKNPMDKGYLNKKLGECDKKYFNILIAHNPIYFDEYVDWGADLIVSGHIHGGIVRLPFIGGIISPTYNLFPKFDGGRFDNGKQTMILSRGLGTHTIPVRFYNPGELSVIRIHGKGERKKV
ncbi:MAG: metallophosphoesterase [Butyrivibrio sp.]|nr:metallophosphoesterase [Butyrivibrio sp.]